MAWVESNDLNPNGKVFYPDLVRALVARYNFRKYPEKVEDFDETKGVTFAGGKFGDKVIEQVVVYAYGIVLDTRLSTVESKTLLEDALEWACKEIGLIYTPSMIRKWQYSSQITFRSKASLMGSNVAYRNLADGISKAVAGTVGESLRYEVTNFNLDYDQLTRKHPLGNFSIQRRNNTPFSENKYYSDAPLPTETHIKLLEQFELDLTT
jgi:hypothetical protein